MQGVGDGDCGFPATILKHECTFIIDWVPHAGQHLLGHLGIPDLSTYYFSALSMHFSNVILPYSSNGFFPLTFHIDVNPVAVALYLGFLMNILILSRLPSYSMSLSFLIDPSHCFHPLPHQGWYLTCCCMLMPCCLQYLIDQLLSHPFG